MIIQVYKIDSNGFYLEPVIIDDSEKIPVDCVAEMPPNYFKAQWVNGAWVEAETGADIFNAAREAKKAQLSYECGLAIVNGFSSSGLGVAHNYPCDEEAQRNFHSELFRFTVDPNYTSCQFKTLDAGYLTHTKTQFFQVFMDGHDYGFNQIKHLNQLKATLDGYSYPTNSVDDINKITF